MSKKTVTSIKELYYGEPLSLTGDITEAKIKTAVLAIIAGNKSITNVHDTTFVYEEEEASVTDYKNQMNGKIYFRDSTPGAVTMAFSVGQYDYATKAALQGGSVIMDSSTPAKAIGWSRPESSDLIYKTIVAITADRTVIVFPRAYISSRGGMVEDKLVGLLLTATAMDTGITGLTSEMWYDESEITPAA